VVLLRLQWFCFFSFLFISAESLKIIVNHRKTKTEKSNFVGLHKSRSTQWTYNIVCFSTKFLL
jgi:hypothetical protein